jgi:hypothetical protein
MLEGLALKYATEHFDVELQQSKPAVAMKRSHCTTILEVVKHTLTAYARRLSNPD